MTYVRRDTQVVGDGRFFVWMKGPLGPEPQIWYGDMKKGNGQFRYGPADPVNGPLLAFHVLAPSDWHIPLDELAVSLALPVPLDEQAPVERLEAAPLS